MYKHSTTHRTLSRRLAALLAALALLAAMALPVYAEAQTEAPMQTQETVETDNNGETGSDVEPDDKSKTNEDTDTGTGAESEDTKDNDSPNPGANSTTPADNAAADNTAPYEEKTDLTEEDTADDGEGPADEAGAKETFFAADTCSEDETGSSDMSAPMAASNEGETTGFIPATATIYFEDNGRYDELSTNGQTCTMRFLGFTRNGKDVFINKDMVDTGKTVTVTGQDGTTIHKIFKVTLNSADYPAGGFYRIAFQYYIDNNSTWKEEINAFGRDDGVNENYLTAIDLLAGKKFVRTGTEESDNDHNHFNQNKKYNPSQWTRVEYYYKDTPLYFKNESDTALTNVTATFYKLENGNLAQPVSQMIGQVDAGKLAAQQILIPDNQSRFVQFSWDNGKSALYDFTTDYTEGSDPAAQKLDLTTTNCYVYNNGTADSWASAGADLLTAGKMIYFDSTFSSYAYAGENTPQNAMPKTDDDGNAKMYCFLQKADGWFDTVEMTSAPDPNALGRQLWSCEIPKDGKTYTAVQFSATNDQNAAAKDDKTKVYSTANIPPTLQEPCFFADNGDPKAYENGNVYREGYWDEKDATRDAESGKGTTVVDIASGTFTQESGTKYITSTLYDYYTDYELNGFNRDTYPDSTTTSQRGYVTFEQFNRALSSAYTNGNVKYPLYTGHFQPSIGGWPCHFKEVAADMKLYGWSDDTNSTKYKTFMAVNNSTLDTEGKGDNDSNKNFYKTFQGLVEDKTSDGKADGLPLLKRSDENKPALADPHFNKDFLQGKNAFNTVLGKVYEDVSFPLKKAKVFAGTQDGSGNNAEGEAEYWYFDSNKTSLYLKQDSNDQSYYLAGNGTNDASLNRDAGNGMNGTHGFFPFNEKVSGSATKYNYGFGAKLQFDFTLTSDGQVVVGNDKKKVPIKFFFSGDDDVWVYIDGKLVLDVGGAHSQAAGLLEFGSGENGNTVTSWVSDAKTGGQVYEEPKQQKTVKFNEKPYIFKYRTKEPKPLENKPIHTLTMYYMERGMWESNMALAFNFPDHNELQVEKKVDVSGVNELFQSSFLNQKIFTFNIQNLATHYGTKETTKPTIKTEELPDTVYKSATGLLRYVSLPENVDKDKGSAVQWESDVKDPTSEHRDQRRGTLTWDTAIDITKYSYLTFEAYVQGDQTDTCALSNLYVELWDTGNKQMGCLGTKGLQSSDVYGAATGLHPGQWYTIRLMLNSLQKDAEFNSKVAKITVGDNFARSIYLRNFTFSSAPTMPEQTGFTTAQYDIPDYGSAKSGNLENAAYAVFSSNRGTGNVVNENGNFLLQAGEIVTFNDQFRRGSYIALKELTDDELYDTSWTVYENGVPVTNVSGNTNVVTMSDNRSLQNVKGTTPNDGRTEQVVKTSLDGNEALNAYKEAQKPKDTDTLVFRSYSDKADANELTKLKVVYTNKVKTGKLVIRKVPAAGETLKDREFTFTVQFSDVGGQSLGEEIKPQEYTCKVEEHDDGYYGEVVIDKIPVGTRFVVSEIATKGTSLKSVQFKGGKDCAITDDGKRVRGTIVKDSPVTATFENTARELIDITVNKVWQTQDGTVIKDGLPTAIYLQLQRTETPDDATSWKPVPEYESVELKPVDYEGWTKLFTGLDKYDANKEENKRVYYSYRVVEGTLSAEGKFEAKDTLLLSDGHTYTCTGGEMTSTTTESKTSYTITLTNTRLNPKFTLDITKADAEKTSNYLEGVEFKLEKLDENGTDVDTNFKAQIGVTNATGKPMLKGEDGKPTDNSAFTGLEAGKYRLTETKAAENYNLLSAPIVVTFTTDGTCTLNGSKIEVSTTEKRTEFTKNEDGSYTLSLTVLNRKTPALPHTGADAPSLWLLIGLPLAVAGLLILVFRYNKKGGRTR